MKKLTNKNFIQKIVIAIVIVTSFNFVVPTVSNAGFGGLLLGAVLDLFAGVGDAVMAGLQYFMDGSNQDIISEEGFMIEPGEFGDGSAFGMTPGGAKAVETIPEESLKDSYGIPLITYSPEKIFSNEVPGLDANFINPKFQGNEKSIASKLQSTIGSWYKALRNLVIVGLLSVLLYVGIRIVISSTTDKAKYKQMLMDWLIALCLVFFLHYIMSFIMTFVDLITQGISGLTTVQINVGSTSFNTNLTGLCRMYVQTDDLSTKTLYLIFYIALIIYTCKFTWQYTKRAITMAFLTLMAPLVTLTYPLDKMGDGKSQAFNMWLKEYIFNALLQPFHLIIYGIFIGSAMDLVKGNPLYAILFLAFITPAEKILRKFFGFDKASTAGASFAGGFGGAAAFNAVKNFANRAAGGKGNQGKGSNGGGNNVRTKKPITDSNAPNGSLTPFANTNNQESSKPQIQSPIYDDEYGDDDVARAMAAAHQSNDDGYGDDDVARAMAATYQNNSYTPRTVENSRPANTNSEDDERGIFEWAKDGISDKWNNSELKDKIGNSKPIRFARNIGDGVDSLKAKAEKGIRKIPKPIRNTIRGVANVGKHAAISGAKFAGRTAVAGLGGAIGLAAGITGDDLDDVFKYAGAGAALGYTTGPAIGRNIVSGIDSAGSAIKHNYEVGKYGEEGAALREQSREWMSDKDNQAFFAEAYEKKNGSKPSVKQLNSTMEVASQYNNSGITDLKQINRGMKLEEELRKELGDNIPEEDATKRARDQAITIMKIANSVDAKDLRDTKKVKDLQQSFVRELQKYDPNLGNTAAAEQADGIIRRVKAEKKVH